MTFGVSMGAGANPEKWARSNRFYRRGPGTLYRKLKSVQFLLTRDRSAILSFLSASFPFVFPLTQRLTLLRDFNRITNSLRGYHTLDEILTVSGHILSRAGKVGLVVVEAGSGSGSSTAKLSLVTKLAGGRLFVFDTFRGIPENEERHRLLDGQELYFKPGAFRGRLSTVMKRVEDHGAGDICTFVKGDVRETMPSYTGHADVVLLDLDLIASTEAAIKHMFPRLRPGGVILSQDGHLQATVDLIRNEDFWRELGYERPIVPGLGVDKLIAIPATTRIGHAYTTGSHDGRRDAANVEEKTIDDRRPFANAARE